LVDEEESAELPVVPALWAVEPALAVAVAPSPVALASECDDVLAVPPPAVALLSE
jgi:hypothetical protein